MKQSEFDAQGPSRGSSSVTRQNEELQSSFSVIIKPKHSHNSRTQRNTMVQLLLQENIERSLGYLFIQSASSERAELVPLCKLAAKNSL